MRLSGHDIVCLSTVDWDHPERSPLHPLMGLLAETNRVLFVDAPCSPFGALAGVGEARFRAKFAAWTGAERAPRRLARNLFVWTPPPTLGLGATLEGGRLASALMRATRRLGLEHPLLWVDAERPGVERVVAAMETSLVIAHALEGRGLSARARRTLTKADLALVSNERQWRALRPELPQALWAPAGIDFDRFNRALYPDTPLPAELMGLPGPVVGYVGAITEAFDFRLWEWLASKRPNWSFVAVGAISAGCGDRAQHAMRLPNVRFLGTRPADATPSYLKAMTTLALPLRRTSERPAALSCYEAFAAGKPVVTSEMRGDELVHQANSRTAFLSALEEAIASTGVRGTVQRVQRAQEHAWEARCQQLEASILARLAQKARPAHIPLQLERIIRQEV